MNNPTNAAGIPIGGGIKIDLQRAIPTELTPELLEEQLNQLGLDCEHTKPEVLEHYIEQVKAELAEGDIQVYSIKRRKKNTTKSHSFKAYQSANPRATLKQYLAGEWVEEAEGNWKPVEAGTGYDIELQTIINEKWFKLLSEREIPTFRGVQGEPQTNTENKSTPDAVKQMFAQTASAAASTVVGGLDKDAVEAAMSNAIAPEEAFAEDVNYENLDDRTLLLVHNYDPVKREADAIGVMNISWDVFIKNYKEKKKERQHETKITTIGRSVLYEKVEDIERDYNYILENHDKNN